MICEKCGKKLKSNSYKCKFCNYSQKMSDDKFGFFDDLTKNLEDIIGENLDNIITQQMFTESDTQNDDIDVKINATMQKFESIINKQVGPTVEDYLEQYRQMSDAFSGNFYTTPKLICCEYCRTKYNELSGNCPSCGGASR